MSFEDKIKNMLKSGLEKMFDLDKMRFDSIMISKDLIDEIIYYAKTSYPKEFLAFFHGEIKNNRLTLDRLVYHQYDSSERSAVPIFHFNDRSFYGSVHSHPSNSNTPSKSDLGFFRKLGIVHCIICKPFTEDNIRFYNHDGDEIIINIEQKTE